MVVVVGGGIAGIFSAMLLKKKSESLNENRKKRKKRYDFVFFKTTYIITIFVRQFDIFETSIFVRFRHNGVHFVS